MITRLALRTVLRSPRRLVIGLLGVAVPVSLFAATAFFVDTSAQKMTQQAIAPVQIDMQALISSPRSAPGPIASQLAARPQVSRVEPFASVDLPVQLPGAAAARTVRVFAVDPSYLARHDWVRKETGSLTQGALITDSLVSPTTIPGSTARIQVPGSSTVVTVPVGGTVDLRKADTWFAVLTGDNQGNVAYVPDAMVVDYATFTSTILPALGATAATPPSSATAVAGSGAAALGVVSLQEHITLDRTAFAADPATALTRSTGLRRTLERTAPGQITVLDNLGDALGAAKNDATNAKVLFLFLGLPGVLVAAGLAVATAGSIGAAQRREMALLRLRGATDAQVSRLSAVLSVGIGVGGSVVGLGLAAVAVTILLGAVSWQGVNVSSLVLSAGLALLVGLTVTAVTLRASSRTVRHSGVATQRAQLDPAADPAWRRRRLDLVAIGIGLGVLAVNYVSGGFRTASTEGQTLSLSFYLLLAPLALWIGVALFGLRVATWWLARATAPQRARPLGSWPSAALRWLGRRPGRSAATALIGVLAVAFGTNLLSFVNTYDGAKRVEAALSIGADLRVTPAQTTPPTVPPLQNPDIAASTPVRIVSLTVGTDKRVAYAVEPGSFLATVPAGPIDAAGQPVTATSLATDPTAVLISAAFAKDFNVVVGDPVNVGLSDGRGGTRNVLLHAVGEFSTATPAVPGADLMFGTGAYALPTVAGATPPATTAAPPVTSTAVPAPDFYLARLTPGADVTTVAARLTQAAGPSAGFTVLTFNDALAKEQSTLATLNLGGLSRIEVAGTVVIATLGIALLGAFLVLERRREYAVLRSLGATTGQVLTPPAIEASITLAVSLVLGVPIGLMMTTITTRVLTPLFSFSPPLVAIPTGQLALLVAAVVAAAAVAVGLALVFVAKLRTVTTLRES